MEIEAKFSVPDHHVYRRLVRCRELAVYTLAPAGVAAVTDKYLDTADGRFLAAGYACRLRTEGKNVLATLKSLSANELPGELAERDAILRRDEQEVQLPEWQPDIAGWPEGPARTLALELSGGEALQPLFDLSQKRARSQVLAGDRLVGELSLDAVSVYVGPQTAHYYEVEIELKGEGAEADLVKLVGELKDTWRLVSETRSKFERALEMLRTQQADARERLAQEEAARLEEYASGADQMLARRATAVLSWARGMPVRAIAARTGLSRTGVRYWVKAFRERKLDIMEHRASVHDTQRQADDEPAEETAPDTRASRAGAGPDSPDDSDRFEFAAPLPELSLEQSAAAPDEMPIAADDPMSEAGRKTLYKHFLRMLANEPGTRAGEDPEALHDMRVATRRMRAACALFAPYFAPDALQTFNKRLRDTGRALGAVRDLDVIMGKARTYAAGLPPAQASALDPLIARWQTEREAARQEMLAHLDSQSYAKFKTRFESFLTTPGAGSPQPNSDNPAYAQVSHIAGSVLLGSYQAVRAYETLIARGAPLTTYHALRIDFKRLRYALEFFKDVLGPEAGGVIKQVTAMQDLLGDLHDANVAGELIAHFLHEQTLARSQEVELTPLEGVASYLIAQWTSERDLLARFPAMWADLTGIAFRRNLAMALAAL